MDVRVTANRRPRYRYGNADLGILGRRPVLETPLSIHVIPSDLIIHQDLRTPEELLRFLPSAQIEARGSTEYGRPQTRGFESDVTDNVRIDGFNAMAPTAQPVEMYERIEVLYGPSAALFGLGSPAGQFNAILKRPTDEPLRRLSLAYLSKSAFALHADLGGRAGRAGLVGYRANLALSDGERYTSGGSERRELGSLALDVRFTDGTLVEGILSGYELDQKGMPAGFTYGTSANKALPIAPDPTRAGFGQRYGGTLGRTGFFELKVHQELGAQWKVAVGASHQITTRSFHSISNTFVNDTEDYSATARESADKQHLTGYVAYVQGRLEIGRLVQDVQLGVCGRVLNGYTGQQSRTFTLGMASLRAPATWAEPMWMGTGGTYQASQTLAESIILGYTATFAERWLATVVGSINWIHTDNYPNPAGQAASKAGAVSSATIASSSYEAQAVVAPTFAIGYKPAEAVHLYANYGMGLQQGPTAPATAKNAMETLAPYRSHQVEVGLKAQFDGLDLTAAAFRIQRPFANVDPSDSVYKVRGEQVNFGLELAVAGRLTRDLSVFGGATLLEPRLTNTSNPATTDRLIVGVPRWQGNLLLEYELPFLPDLATTFIAHYTGVRAANDTNTSIAPEYATFDVAVRYGLRVNGYRAVLRGAVKNLLDEHYWVSLFPGSINGESASYSAFLGAPRTYELSLRVDL